MLIHNDCDCCKRHTSSLKCSQIIKLVFFSHETTNDISRCRMKCTKCGANLRYAPKHASYDFFKLDALISCLSCPIPIIVVFGLITLLGQVSPYCCASAIIVFFVIWDRLIRFAIAFGIKHSMIGKLQVISDEKFLAHKTYDEIILSDNRKEITKKQRRTILIVMVILVFICIVITLWIGSKGVTITW